MLHRDLTFDKQCAIQTQVIEESKREDSSAMNIVSLLMKEKAMWRFDAW